MRQTGLLDGRIPARMPLDTDNDLLVSNNSITLARLLDLLMVEFKPAGSKIGELAACFDIVLGDTPEEPEHRWSRCI